MELATFILIFLVVISAIDLKWKAVPSVLMTGTLFITAIVSPLNLHYATLLAIFGLLLYEFNFMSGIADLKASAIIGFTIDSHNEVFLFMLILTGFGVLYKILSKYVLKEKHEVAFLPVFLISYVATKLIMGIIFGGNWLW